MIPKEIKIGGHIYKVVYPYTFTERQDAIGQCNNEILEIRISEMDQGGHKIPDSSIMVTFIHEVLHAIDYRTGHCVFENDENAIDGIANMLFQVLLDNGMVTI